MWGFTCAAATRGQSYKPTCGNLSWVHHCSLTALVRLTQRRGNITRAGAYAAFLLFCSSATRRETPTSPDEGEIRRDLLPEDGSCPPTARAEGEPVPVSVYRAKQMWPDDAAFRCRAVGRSPMQRPVDSKHQSGVWATIDTACVQRQDVAICVVAVAHTLSALFLLNSFPSTLRDQQTHGNH